MNAFWKAAVGVSGFAAVGAFVFYSLYMKWLEIWKPEKLSQE